jgi:hypothetical protein
MKIRINKLPKKLTKALVGKQVQGSLAITPSAWGGGDYNDSLANKQTQVRDTLQPVPRNLANLEAERGEYAYGGISGDNIPDNFKIGGKRHSKGGTPLDLPEGSFIFSDTASMKIKDPSVLKMFDLKPKKGGYTPADIAKKYDINSYKKLLYDPNTDELTRKTATIMIKNYIMKLGYLSIVQEAMKGFPQGMPEVAKPVLETMGYSMEQFVPEPVQQGQQEIMAQEQSENEMPTEMPNGEPIASMETMYGDDANAQQIPVNPSMPMAEYGMTLGGYDMPMYPNGGIIIQPYGRANTPAGNETPTAKSNTWSSRQQPLPEFLAGWEQHVPGISQMTEGQAQKAMYEWALENNPSVIRDMWKEWGLTAAGRDIPSLERLTIPGDDYRHSGHTGVFDDATLEDIENLRALQEGFVDNKFGARQLSYDYTPPEKKGCPCEDGTYSEECCPDTQKKGCPCEDGTYSEECCPDTRKKKCKCVDPQTGVETITEIAEGEECNCPGGSFEQQGFQDTPVYSDIASRNILTQMTMDPTVPRSSSVMPSYTETPGAYKDYLADIQNIGRGQSAMMDMIQGTAGNEGSAFAKAMTTAAQSQAANQAAVNATQTDNINAARQVGQYNAQTKALNNAQRAEIMNQQLLATQGEKLQEVINRNQLDQNKQAALQDAESELQGRLLSNFTNQQYGTTYRRGVPYFKQGKPNVPEKSTDVNERVKQLQAIYGKDAKIGDLLQIIKMEQQQQQPKLVKKGGQATGGGYILGENIFPFMFY